MEKLCIDYPCTCLTSLHVYAWLLPVHVSHIYLFSYSLAYTEAQRKSMLEEMEQVRKEFESDSELAEILDRYILEIKEAKTE